MLKKISISNYKSFHPTKAVEIELDTSTQKPVLFYGLNGAGKSSIGEVIHGWGEKNPAFAHCSVEISGQGSYRPVVYNSDFVDRVIGGVAGMPGIFTLGELDTQSQKKIEEITPEIAAAEARREELKGLTASATNSLTAAKNTALAEVWKAHAAHSGGELQPLIQGYGNNRQNFFDALKAIQVAEDEELDTIENLKKRLAEVSGAEPQKSKLSLREPGFQEIELDAIWQERIVVSGQSRLAPLIEKWGNSDWVNKGREFAHDPECPFCQQAMPHDLLAELSKLLDGDRQAKIDHIQSLAQRYEAAISALEASVDQALQDPFAKEDAGLAGAWSALKLVLQTNLIAMKAKIEKPSEPANIAESCLSDLLDKLAVINQRISGFNQRISDRDAEKRRIKAEFWKVLRRDRAAAFSTYDAMTAPLLDQKAGYDKEDSGLATKLGSLNVTLAELRRKQTGVDAAMVAINQRLSNMGISAFSIARKSEQESLYCLNRQGKNSGELKSLSEGEKTLISFLYYMELLKGSVKEGETFQLDKTIVVIDDPISSLSVNYVFDIAAVICKELIAPAGGQKVRQVIVLTHNLFFLHELMKQLSATDKNGKCQLFRVTKNSHTQVSSMKASELMNDYDALWFILREARDQQLPAHVVPNTMRCILEHFFSFNNKDEEFKAALGKLEQQDNRFVALARFLDRGSHKDGINFSVMDYADYDLAYYLEKFKAVFDEAGFQQHYEARMVVA
ncbi:MAG TPA: AAA family ATPase [Eoetvoesiella sp.]|uniref:AAA family ATPase n=1 Tax=Eoetvoesiella sp. TaxID=1966355 RepID=UPI002CD8A884|nr:AAA family ATPase [Eoetvoesiella sp.]HWK62110.1 AAA family ATPase [Eoetvoesiella sp.]